MLLETSNIPIRVLFKLKAVRIGPPTAALIAMKRGLHVTFHGPFPEGYTGIHSLTALGSWFGFLLAYWNFIMHLWPLQILCSEGLLLCFLTVRES
jgi:hypothetical protein